MCVLVVDAPAVLEDAMRLLAGAADAAAASTMQIAVEIAAMWLVVFMVFAVFLGLALLPDLPWFLSFGIQCPAARVVTPVLAETLGNYHISFQATCADMRANVERSPAADFRSCSPAAAGCRLRVHALRSLRRSLRIWRAL